MNRVKARVKLVLATGAASIMRPLMFTHQLAYDWTRGPRAAMRWPLHVAFAELVRAAAIALAQLVDLGRVHAVCFYWV